MHVNIKLVEMVEDILDEADVELKGHEKTKLRGIEREAQAGEMEADDILDDLKKIDTIKETFSSRDFDDLEKKINKVL